MNVLVDCLWRIRRFYRVGPALLGIWTDCRWDLQHIARPSLRGKERIDWFWGNYHRIYKGIPLDSIFIQTNILQIFINYFILRFPPRFQFRFFEENYEIISPISTIRYRDPPTFWLLNFIILIYVGKKLWINKFFILPFVTADLSGSDIIVSTLWTGTKILNCHLPRDRSLGHPPVLKVKRVWCNLSMAGAPVCNGTVGRAVSCCFCRFF
jgi:hypothetical protein